MEQVGNDERFSEDVILHREVPKSFAQGGKVVNLVDARSDRGSIPAIAIGDASRVVLAGSSTWAPGIADRMGSEVWVAAAGWHK